jgi:quinolinate synthase
MKLNTLVKLHRCMADRTPSLEMPTDLRVAALAPLQRMLEWS